jgi:hypothetical protein
MSNENIQLKIDLLQEQIDNLEKSGFFTEMESDSRTKPLKSKLLLLENAQQLYTAAETARRLADQLLNLLNISSCDRSANVDFGLSKESYAAGDKLHQEFFGSFSALKMNVVDAEVLTPTNQED